jgi:cell wall-associated NlpC family hydrolase
MKHWGSGLVATCLLLCLVAQAAPLLQPAGEAPASATAWESMKGIIQGYLGKPYAWGGTGIKSFDCSGFIWRVMADNGILIKRTTARKLYIILPKPPEDAVYSPGNIVFFNDLRHCGIVNDRATFYHAQSSIGTNLSTFSSYWRPLITGFRCLTPEKSGAAAKKRD